MYGVHVDKINDIMDKKNKKYNIFQLLSQHIDYTDTRSIRYVKKNNINIVIHASYTINLAKQWDKYSVHVNQFIDEIKQCNVLNARAIVIHTGKQLHLSLPEALNNMYTCLLYIHKKTSQYRHIKILIETPSGQGTELLTDIVKFCKFINKFNNSTRELNDRFGICIDTCHIFAAGYDIREKKVLKYFFSTIDKMCGMDKIKLCHFNDSLYDCGSRIDRHAVLGKGFMKKSIQMIGSMFVEFNIPIVFETPDREINKYQSVFI